MMRLEASDPQSKLIEIDARGDSAELVAELSAAACVHCP
jgi:hypothetical protein